MPVSAISAAKRLCSQSNWTLTNLKLQKLLYIANMVHLGEEGRPLIDGSFEAWDYGPVVPEVYRQVKAFGSDPIANIFRLIPDLPEGTERAALDDTLHSLGTETAGKLVAITHWEKGAWAAHYTPGQRGILIPNVAIANEFSSRMGND
jgi:uncharacterized phage-associated protein